MKRRKHACGRSVFPAGDQNRPFMLSGKPFQASDKRAKAVEVFQAPDDRRLREIAANIQALLVVRVRDNFVDERDFFIDTQ